MQKITDNLETIPPKQCGSLLETVLSHIKKIVPRICLAAKTDLLGPFFEKYGRTFGQLATVGLHRGRWALYAWTFLLCNFFTLHCGLQKMNGSEACIQ
jgi:hypothetical protein